MSSRRPQIAVANAHYTVSEIQPIDVIEAWNLGFRLGNTVKYIARAEYKGAPLEDLEKALWYLEREVEKRRAASAKAKRVRS